MRWFDLHFKIDIIIGLKTGHGILVVLIVVGRIGPCNTLHRGRDCFLHHVLNQRLFRYPLHEVHEQIKTAWNPVNIGINIA